MHKILKNKRGVIFIMAIVMTILFLFVGLAGSKMIVQDTYMIKRLKYSMQAQYLAEAGMSDALARLCSSFSLSIFPVTGTLGEGSYSVSQSTSNGRVLLTSTGTVTGSNGASDAVSCAVTAEVEDTTPTALNFIMSAGNDLKVRGGFLTASFLNGNIHGNNNVYLATGLALGYVNVTGTATHFSGNTYVDTYFGWIDVDGYPRFGIGTHVTRPAWDGNAVTFPSFDYPYLAQVADDAADTCYYSSGHTFDGVTLTPSCGFIYVNGEAKFRNNCHIYGGIIADSIKVENYVTWVWILPIVHKGTLTQHVAGGANQIVARLGNIDVAGELHTAGALVYAAGDFRSIEAGAIVDVTGVISASSNLTFWDFLAVISYTYQKPSVTFGPNINMVKLDSWNR